MLELEPLPPAALRQVYEWDHGEKFEPFETYAARLSGPNWTHYAILDGGRFIGSISLELTGPTTCSIHVAKTPGAGRLHDLRRVLICIGDMLFNAGMNQVVVYPRIDNRASKYLAAACGMQRAATTSEFQYYTLTSEQYMNSWMRKSIYAET